MTVSIERKAEIVAFARLLGVHGNDDDIIEQYLTYYEKAYATFSKASETKDKAVAFKRPL